MIRAKKSLGQNFLIDRRIARRIVDAVSPQPRDVIFEIGPGTGAITRLLVEQSGLVAAIEIDSRLVEELRRQLVSEKLCIIEADALSIDWVNLISSTSRRWSELHTERDEQPRARAVANLPYYISTPIIGNLIKLRSFFDLTLMLQSEVVERITSEPDSREYGYLSVLVQYHCTAAKLFEVPPSAFRPAPKVWSAVIRLAMRERPIIEVEDEEKFFALVRAAFAQRRKTILNNLKAAARALGFEQRLEPELERAGIDPRRRAETLSLEEFGAVYRALYRA